MGFLLFFQKSLFTENYFLIAATNLATRGPLCTCLVCCKIHEVYLEALYLWWTDVQDFKVFDYRISGNIFPDKLKLATCLFNF